MTFGQWLEIWQRSGHLHKRGVHGYVMARRGDKGPYSVENVDIVHCSVNSWDAALTTRQKINGVDLETRRRERLARALKTVEACRTAPPI